MLEDWRRLYEAWDNHSEDEKREIDRLLRKLEDTGKLGEFLAKNIWADKVFKEKVTPKPVEWTKRLEQRLRDVFEATLRAGLPEEGVPGLSPHRFWPEFRLELEAAKMLASEEEMEKHIQRLAKSILRREAPKIMPKRPPTPVTPVEHVPWENRFLAKVARYIVRSPVTVYTYECRYQGKTHVFQTNLKLTKCPDHPLGTLKVVGEEEI